MSSQNDHYVYVYIDPRNNEEFYYGMGRGSRKNAHLKDAADSEKSARIGKIREQRLEPIIRVIARQLTRDEALLIEKTLLWKLGKWTTNIATGYFAKKFRPQDTLHQPLHNFDFQNSIYYYNVGENDARNWDDYRKYGYISAGRGRRYRDYMMGFHVGDVIAAYLGDYGYVGIGRIKEPAAMIRDVRINGTRLLDLPLIATAADHDCDDIDNSEYVCLVRWVKRVPRERARWRARANLFTVPNVRASLDRQPATLRFLEREFGISLENLVR